MASSVWAKSCMPCAGEPAQSWQSALRHAWQLLPSCFLRRHALPVRPSYFSRTGTPCLPAPWPNARHPAGRSMSRPCAARSSLVTSREVARKAIRRLELVGNAEFDPLVGPMDPLTRVRTMLGLANGSFDGREEGSHLRKLLPGADSFTPSRARVSSPSSFARLIRSSLRARPTLWPRIYLDQLEEAQGELARAASDWLGANIEELRERVSDAEEAVEDFRSSSRLFLSGDSSNVSSQQLSDLKHAPRGSTLDQSRFRGACPPAQRHDRGRARLRDPGCRQ